MMLTKREPNGGWIMRFFLSAIFILSATGKLIDVPASVSSFNLFFDLPHTIVIIASFLWLLIEITLALLIWRHKIISFWLVVPLVLLAVTLYSFLRGIDCGCFGSLPYLSQFSLTGHLMLLAGMFLGLYYLSITSKGKQDETAGSQSILANNKLPAPQWISVCAVVLMASAFLTLPFSSSTGHALESGSKNFVELADVEAAIADRSAILIDARPEFQFELGHIPNALNLPYDAENLSEVITRFSLQDHPLIVYCSSPHCNAAELLAEKLRAYGCENVRVFAGGWEEWVKSGKEKDWKG